VYLAACRIMLAPIVNFAQLRTASFGGDVRAFIWVLAWDNHAVLDRVPSLFDANKLFPLQNSLAYGEHLFGISLFTLPIYAATRNPVLAYNVVWLLAYLLTAAAVHALAWRYTRDHLAAMTAALAFTFCFFRMHHGHGHLNLIWCFWIPLVPRDGSLDGTADLTRIGLLTAVIVLQALAAWYQAVLIAVADLIFSSGCSRRNGGRFGGLACSFRDCWARSWHSRWCGHSHATISSSTTSCHRMRRRRPRTLPAGWCRPRTRGWGNGSWRTASRGRGGFGASSPSTSDGSRSGSPRPASSSRCEAATRWCAALASSSSLARSQRCWH
jgi:hypothetical protein